MRGFFVRYPLTVQGGERVHVQGLRDELVNLFEFIMCPLDDCPVLLDTPL